MVRNKVEDKHMKLVEFPRRFSSTLCKLFIINSSKFYRPIKHLEMKLEPKIIQQNQNFDTKTNKILLKFV